MIIRQNIPIFYLLIIKDSKTFNLWLKIKNIFYVIYYYSMFLLYVVTYFPCPFTPRRGCALDCLMTPWMKERLVQKAGTRDTNLLTHSRLETFYSPGINGGVDGTASVEEAFHCYLPCEATVTIIFYWKTLALIAFRSSDYHHVCRALNH